MNATLDELLRQARRLRFRDPAMEARYDEDRFTSGMVRERVTMAACALAGAALGLFEAYGSVRLYEFPGLMLTLHLVRFYGVIPLWVGLCVATYWRGFSRWAGTANAVVTVLSCWGFSFIDWMLLCAQPDRSLANMLTGTTLLVLIVALLMLPMRFRSMAGVVVFSLGGTLWFFNATLGGLPVHADNLRNANFALPLVAGLIVIGGWFREAADRRLFAQREHARHLAAELAAANAELARLNAEQAVFMGIAAHDLRAPLATVRGYAELLQNGRLPEGEARQTALREIEAESARMLSLVSDYLGAHAAAGRADPAKLARVDLGASARAAAARHAPAAAAKAQMIELADAPPAWARADEARLAQVVDNFVANALKFSPRGTAVRLAVARRDGVVRLAVADDGPGIPPEEQAGLFRMFGRGSARPTGGEPSHGLGLAVAKRLAESMDGAVGCESAPGCGATFWIELPAEA